MARKLTPEQVRRVCPPESLGFETTEGLETVSTIIGQSRALQALQFGLGIAEAGFNIYAAGLPGTGKMTAITAFLHGLAQDKETPPDWCYVHNFQDPYRPKALKLKAGLGIQLQRDMRKFIEDAQRDIRKAFESEDYIKRRDATSRVFNERKEELFKQLNQLAHDKGFAMQVSTMGILLIPMVEGRPLTEQEMLALSPEVKESIAKRREDIQDQMKDALAQMRSWDREMREQIEKMDREVVQFALGMLIEELMAKYGENPRHRRIPERGAGGHHRKQGPLPLPAGGPGDQPLRPPGHSPGLQKIRGERPGG